MAQYFLDPVTPDVKAQWTESPAGSAFAVLDDGVRQPTAPTIGSDYIESSTAAQICQLEVGTTTLAGGETVVSAKVWFYIDAGLRDVTVSLQTGSVGLASATYLSDVAAGWYSAEHVGPLTQAEVNGLRIQIQLGNGFGAKRVYAGYAELNTRTDVWAAGNLLLTGVRSPSGTTMGLSTGAGFLGADICTSVDLGTGRSLLLFGDTHRATASGQQQALGTHTHVPAAPRATFIRNSVGILSAYNIDTATLTNFTGASNTEYFPSTTFNGAAVLRWAYRGVVRSGRLFVMGALASTSGLVEVAGWGAYCDNWSSNPTNPALWTWTYITPWAPLTQVLGRGDVGVTDPGDGFVYMWSIGPNSADRSIYRLAAADFQAGSWSGGQWWTGSGWSKDKKGAPIALPPMVIGRKKPRGNVWGFPVAGGAGGNAPSGGTVHRRSGDSKYQMTAIFDSPLEGTQPFNMGYSLTPGTAVAKFPEQTDKFEIPEGEDFVYGGACHPQLTFTGAGANDQVWSYCTNRLVSNNQGTLYYPRFVKALSIT